MARLTVEDCLKFVKNRFELVLKASKRARSIERGADPRVPRDNDKPTVIALREISMGLGGQIDKEVVEAVDAMPKSNGLVFSVEGFDDDEEFTEGDDFVEDVAEELSSELEDEFVKNERPITPLSQLTVEVPRRPVQPQELSEPKEEK